MLIRVLAEKAFLNTAYFASISYQIVDYTRDIVVTIVSFIQRSIPGSKHRSKNKKRVHASTSCDCDNEEHELREK